MQITQNEISAIEEAGDLDGLPVKMIKTKGGFYIAVGTPRGKMREEALAAGSHPAIVKYNLSKQYPAFRESMMKSETMIGNEGLVDKHSHFLSDDLRKAGHEVYSVTNGPEVVFHVTQHGRKVGQARGHKQDSGFVVTELEANDLFSRALAGAAVEMAMSVGARTMKLDVK